MLGAATSEPVATDPVELTDAVRRKTLAQVTGPEFRRAVASLAERRLLRATVARKADDDVGRVVIEDVTPLGRAVVRTMGDQATHGERGLAG